MKNRIVRVNNMRCSEGLVSPMAHLFATCGKPTQLLLLAGLVLTLSLLSRGGIAAESCSGTAVDINNRTFYAGETAACVATISIDIGPTVTLDSFSDVTLKAPTITFTPPFNVVDGATLSTGPDDRRRQLNDTGITWGDDYPDGKNTTCTSNITGPQDCHQGRDATHIDDSDGHAGFSYTKISSTGIPLPASATSWSCVKDNVTGLTWEVKTDDDGIHDWDNIYRWGGKTHLGSGFGTYYNDWDTLIDGSNDESLCGFSNWRVPTIMELASLTNRDRVDPAIDTDYFPYTPVWDFFWEPVISWSASPFADDSDYAWHLYFSSGESGGGINSGHGRSSYGAVRLVRGGE